MTTADENKLHRHHSHSVYPIVEFTPVVGADQLFLPGGSFVGIGWLVMVTNGNGCSLERSNGVDTINGASTLPLTPVGPALWLIVRFGTGGGGAGLWQAVQLG
jgi:hypothetical protein